MISHSVDELTDFNKAPHQHMSKVFYSFSVLHTTMKRLSGVFPATTLTVVVIDADSSGLESVCVACRPLYLLPISSRSTRCCLRCIGRGLVCCSLSHYLVNSSGLVDCCLQFWIRRLVCWCLP